MLRKTLFILCVPMLAAGCIVVDGRKTDEMPVGVTLLETDRGECYGPIEFEADPDVIVGEGEDATFQVDDDDVEWHCMSASHEFGEMECPDETRYVRVTRDEDDADFTLECFGA